MKKKDHFGQFFTPENLVQQMLLLIHNQNPQARYLEPSAGNGAFFQQLPAHKIGIELDQNAIKQKEILNIDFFDYPLNEKFDVIIGNPPYVKYQNILPKTKKNLLKNFHSLFYKNANLYLFFIYKCILHLKENGELVFITPRDFMKSTSAKKLNEFIFQQGSITHFIDLGDVKLFSDAQPNCAIWRFEKNNFNFKNYFHCIQGQLFFTQNNYPVFFKDLFFVKVGAVSGSDLIFENEKYGNLDFVCSKTNQTGKTKKMIYYFNDENKNYLKKYKTQLLNRKIKKMNENNWWEWGRDYFKSDLPRIYVNCKTRYAFPFFIHSVYAYDGSVLAIFPKFKVNEESLKQLCFLLNQNNWQDLGFVCDGRFLFSQQSLENSLLNESFLPFLKKLEE